MQQTAYIFDADGVLNDIHTYETDPRVIAQIAKLLENGTFVAINTGRDYHWLSQNVLHYLYKAVTDKGLLDRLFVSMEMGGVTMSFTHGQERKTHSAFSLTAEQIALVRKTYDAHPELASKLGWPNKESMATMDKLVGADVGEFREAQHAMAKLLRELFADQDDVTINMSNDAVDAHASEAGKRAGAQLIYDWLSQKTDVPHDRFICFGDSLVDYEMARFFADQSHDTIFVCTNPAIDVADAPGITVVKTKQTYSAGTYEYLRKVTS